MSAKKVFTHTGELLSKFLLEIKENNKNNEALDNVLVDILSVNTTVHELYWNIKHVNREEVLAFLKKETTKEIENLKITDGNREIQILEATQLLWDSVAFLDAKSEGQFQAIAESHSNRFAEIYKKIGKLNRSYIRGINNLLDIISKLQYKKLDYFIGDAIDKSMVYYKFTGSELRAANGIKTNQLFHQMLRVQEIAAAGGAAGDYVLGKKVYLGGIKDAQFNEVVVTQNMTAEGNITIADGFELIGTALKSRYGDVAEYYSSDKIYSPGTLVQLDLDNSTEVTQYLGKDDSIQIGIVSENPGFILNEGIINEDPNIIHLPIVLTGKSPVKVFGDVRKGDALFPLTGTSQVGCCIAIQYNRRLKYQNDFGVNQIGIALESSIPSIGNYEDINLVMAKIN